MDSSTDEGLATAWEALDLPGSTLDLIDETQVQTLRFNADGWVAAIVGTRHGPLAAPLWRWRIDAGRLLLCDSEHAHPLEALSAPRVRQRIVSATRDGGATVRYTLSSP